MSVAVSQQIFIYKNRWGPDVALALACQGPIQRIPTYHVMLPRCGHHNGGTDEQTPPLRGHHVSLPLGCKLLKTRTASFCPPFFKQLALPIYY